ncbi:MAG: T9SS type A sorting domain-containing protein [Candidatus Zixiibacteriota bacterium]
MSRLTLTLAIAVLALGLLTPSMVSASPTGSDDLFAPVFITRPNGLSYSHCDTARYKFQAVSAATGLPSIWVRYRVVSGPGTIDSVTGEWKLPPSHDPALVGSFTLVVGASELGLVTEGLQNQYVSLRIYAELPYIQFTAPNSDRDQIVKVGQTGYLDWKLITNLSACDTAWVFVRPSSGDFHGQVELQPYNDGWRLSFTPDSVDAGQYRYLYFGVTNGFDSNLYVVYIEVPALPLYAIRIQSIHDQHQGQFAKVSVTMDRKSDVVPIGGFDFLLAYDNSALSLQGVTPTALYNDCKWEYFTYRYGAIGNCSGGCPSGMVRVVGLAETNNGNDKHPTCYNPAAVPEELFTMTFLTSNNRIYECGHIPIQFFWIDCGDNVMAYQTGEYVLAVNRVFDRDSSGQTDIQVDSSLATFPGYAGIPIGACYGLYIPPYNTDPKRVIDFYNGSINVACSESIDARGAGDMNCNGVPWELSDYVVYMNYFLHGVAAFGGNVNCANAASDINADGIELTVADLAYMAQVIIGNALPYPKGDSLRDSSSNVTMIAVVDSPVGGILTGTDDTLGAAFFVFEGDAVVSNWTTGYQFVTYFNGTNTHVLIAPQLTEPREYIFSGHLLRAVNRADTTKAAKLISADVATYAGLPVRATIDYVTGTPDERGNNLPTQFALHQNYPNPFNAGTVIDFDLPTSSNVSLDIFNILGQTVWTSTSHYAAGSHRIEWTGNLSAGGTASSGVYYYRLTAGSFVETKKMVLLK